MVITTKNKTGSPPAQGSHPVEARLRGTTDQDFSVQNPFSLYHGFEKGEL
jgi:hypothetical protein